MFNFSEAVYHDDTSHAMKYPSDDEQNDHNFDRESQRERMLEVFFFDIEINKEQSFSRKRAPSVGIGKKGFNIEEALPVRRERKPRHTLAHYNKEISVKTSEDGLSHRDQEKAIINKRVRFDQGIDKLERADLIGSSRKISCLSEEKYIHDLDDLTDVQKNFYSIKKMRKQV